jgi:hypothetical protein
MPAKKTSTEKKTTAKKTTITVKKTIKATKKSSSKSVKKLDFKKEFPDFYDANTDPSIVTVPSMLYLMVDGKGDPNNNESFEEGIGLLYNVSYTIKMGRKSGKISISTPGPDYTVPPLEGLWYMENMAEWSMDTKNKWEWTIMIRVPDFVSESEVQEAITQVKEKKNPAGLARLYVKKYDEGESVQILHLGPYDDEPPIIQRLHEFAKKSGYKLDGKHHEIYLTNALKCEPSKMRTVLRQPVQKL